MNNEKILSNDELLKITGGAKFICPILKKQPIKDTIIGDTSGLNEHGHPLPTPHYGFIPIDLTPVYE